MEGCAECNWELGPPPDSIMDIPPPPMPAFLHLAPTNISTPSCSILCDWNTGQGVEYIELPRQGPLMDNTWLMVLVTSCVGVLLFGSLLALILLKFRGDDSGKVKSSSGSKNGSGSKKCEAVLYPIAAADCRAIWATLTPRGGTTTLVAPISSFDNSAYHLDTDAEDPSGGKPPRVSCPTRIEHPNLPPLNLHRTLRRNKTDYCASPIV